MAIKKKLLECREDCKLCEGVRTPFMPISGSTDAPVLFIGESPGEQEDIQGIQFVGRAGKLLREALTRFNITDFAMDNVCCCRPPDNKTPTKKEIETCLPRLLENISKMPNLKVIVALGNIALQALTGQRNITKLSGKLLPYKNGIQIMPILHPSYILRNQHESKTFFDHIGRIPNAITGSLTGMEDFGNYIIIDSLEVWEEFLVKLRKYKVFSYDVETNGLNPFVENFLIKCISFSVIPYESYILPLSNNESNFSWDGIYIYLNSIFTSKRYGKCGHTIKFDNLCMWVVLGIKVIGTIWDISTVAHLLNENESHGLKNLAWRYSKIGGYERTLSENPDKLDGPELWRYNGIDSDLTERIRRIQLKEMEKEPELLNLLNTLLIPVSDTLLEMEYRGIRIDPVQLDLCLDRTSEYIDSLVKQIKQEPSVSDFEKGIETEFNPNSHIQLRELLFKYEGLQPIKFTDKTKAPSTDRETLDILSGESNLCKLLSEYSLYSSLRSKTIGELYNYKTKDNRIHTSFYIDSTVTGRTSSREPNLQNVPKGKKDVVGIRKIFIPDDDFLFAEIDMNQHELRCMAEEARDLALLEALEGDVHLATACTVLGKKPEDVTKEERDRIGKVINFSLIYKVSAYGLSRSLKCDENTAKKYISRFFDKYNRTFEWMRKTEDFVKKNGYVRSRIGRYRRFPIWDEFNDKLIREAVNMPIQSLAGDILLYALLGVDRFLTAENLKSFIILEIHDSIIVNIHKSELNILSPIKEIMESYFKKFVPFESNLKADIKIGPNWFDLKEISI